MFETLTATTPHSRSFGFCNDAKFAKTGKMSPSMPAEMSYVGRIWRSAKAGRCVGVPESEFVSEFVSPAEAKLALAHTAASKTK